MNHQIQQLTCFCLELELLGMRGHFDPFLFSD